MHIYIAYAKWLWFALNSLFHRNNVSEITFVPYALKDYDAYTKRVADVINTWGKHISLDTIKNNKQKNSICAINYDMVSIQIYRYSSEGRALRWQSKCINQGRPMHIHWWRKYICSAENIVRIKFDRGYSKACAGRWYSVYWFKCWNKCCHSLHRNHQRHADYISTQVLELCIFISLIWWLISIKIFFSICVYVCSFDALNLVPFNINPHYLDVPDSDTHQGETREERVQQFVELNKRIVLGLREGTCLLVDGDKARLVGELKSRLFRPYVYCFLSLLIYIHTHIYIWNVDKKSEQYFQRTQKWLISIQTCMEIHLFCVRKESFDTLRRKAR